MTTANSPAPNEVVTAALLVIGDKILSGRTKDKNIAYIATFRLHRCIVPTASVQCSVPLG